LSHSYWLDLQQLLGFEGQPQVGPFIWFSLAICSRVETHADNRSFSLELPEYNKSSNSKVGFLLGRRNIFLLGRNGRNWGETSRCVYFKVQSIIMCKPWYKFPSV